jgi:hypothetical protein
MSGKLLGFKVAGYLDQPYCLAVITKGLASAANVGGASNTHGDMKDGG